MVLPKFVTTYLFPQEQRKWSWAKRHPWQSWRDRYCKNKDSFDRRIRQHQKKHGINANEPRKAFSSARQKRARDDASEEDSEEDGEGSEDDRKRKRQRVEERQRRVKIERERRESLKEEEDKGEGTSRGALGGKMRHKPVSTAKQAQDKPQVANLKKPTNGRPVGENEDADDESSDEEEENHGPIGSDDYEGSIFAPSEDEVEEVEVIELTDADNEEEIDAQEVSEQLNTLSKSVSTTSSSRDK
jgi:hypothetical protein